MKHTQTTTSPGKTIPATALLLYFKKFFDQFPIESSLKSAWAIMQGYSTLNHRNETEKPNDVHIQMWVKFMRLLIDLHKTSQASKTGKKSKNVIIMSPGGQAA